MVKARGRARTEQIRTQHTKQREKGETPTAGWRKKVDGDGQTSDAGNDEVRRSTQNMFSINITFTESITLYFHNSMLMHIKMVWQLTTVRTTN